MEPGNLKLTNKTEKEIKKLSQIILIYKNNTNLINLNYMKGVLGI